MNMNDLPRRAPFFALVLIIMAIFTLFPLLQTGFTTYDDTRTALSAIQFKDTLRYPIESVLSQGRITDVNIFLKWVPYLFENSLFYQLIRLGSILLNFTLFYLIAKFISKSTEFAMFGTMLLFCYVQNNWQHSLLTSYPFIYQFGFASFLLSLIFYWSFVKTGKARWGILAGASYFLAMSTYEAFVAYVPVYLGMVFCHKFRNENTTHNTFLKISRAFLPIAVSMGVFLILYFLFYWMSPGNYAGTKIAAFSLKKILRVISQLSVGTFPTAFYFADPLTISKTFDGFSPYHTASISFLNVFRVEWLVKAIIASCCTWAILQYPRNIFSSKTFIISVLFGLAFIALPFSMIALTVQYQDWVINAGTLAYVPSYFSFFGTILLLTCIFFYLNQVLNRNKLAHTAYLLFASGFVFITCAATDYYNYYATRDQALCQLKWTTLDLFLITPAFDSIPAGSVIYSPTLWKTRGIVENDPAYWSDYIKVKTGKRLHVISRRNDLIVQPPDTVKPPLYFLSYHQEAKDKNQFMVFARIEDLEHPVSGSVKLFLLSRYSSFTITAPFIGHKNDTHITINGTELADRNIGMGFFSKKISRMPTPDRSPSRGIKQKSFLGRAQRVLKRIFMEEDHTKKNTGKLYKTVISSTSPIQLENILISFFPVSMMSKSKQ